MKKILLILLVLYGLPFAVNAQSVYKIPEFSIDSATKKVTYSAIIQAQGISKDVLYSRAKEWVALNFKSARNVVQLDDKDAGKLIIKGLFDDVITAKYIFKSNIEFSVNFTMAFTVKEGRFRVVINNLMLQATSKGWEQLRSGSAESYLAEIDAYNKKHKRSYDDDDDNFLISKSKSAEIHGKMLQAMDLYLAADIESIKKALLLPVKDDF